MSGHLFVTCGNILNFSCDAWLLPTDVSLYVNEGWRPLPAVPDRPAAWTSGKLRALLAPAPASPDDRRDAWWTNTGGGHATDVSWFVAGAVEFVTLAAKALRGLAKVTERSRPLLAVPLVGTGLGGGGHRAGSVLLELLPALRHQATKLDVDIVFVARSPWVASLAQALRRRTMAAECGWSEIPEPLAGEALRLARLAASGQLVLFIGAGVGRSAGLPLWEDLLDGVAGDAGLGPDERESLKSLDLLDRARLLELRLGGKHALGQSVSRRVTAARYGLCHSLLASLPVHEAVTTNYDTLFERASTDANMPCRVLPYEPSLNRRRWLLKLHGCVNHPDHIVISRDDYLRYAVDRGALAGIVQALLVTRHMLFVGFGLADDNFHRIAYEVRSAVGAGIREEALGTALQLSGNPLKEELWRGDIAFVPVAETQPDPKESSRRLEIFLDLLAAHACTGTDYLLDDRYSDALTPDERLLKSELTRVAEAIQSVASGSVAGERVRVLLEAMGLSRNGGP